jgi:diguanylate cyclase (GGDEF)-like protein
VKREESVVGITHPQLTFRAALARLFLGVPALVLLPLLFPRLQPHVWVLGAYLGVAAIEQVLIAKGYGGQKRAFVAGLIDVLFLTFLIHRIGSTTSVFAAVYFLVGTLNALVIGLRVGVSLAVLNAVAYDVVVWAEWSRRIPFAPDGPDLTRDVPPTLQAAITATSLVTILLVTSTTIVGMLVHSVRKHETELTAANRRLDDLSQRDPLTGLFNRRQLFTRLEHELARVKRGHALAVVMLDLDAFKHINDGQGHLGGDLLLKEIALALTHVTREVDLAARYGGDEFMLVLQDTDARSAHVVAERITSAVRSVGTKFDAQRPVTASVGVAIAHVDDSIASIIRRADESAYRAKKSGGDRVEESA